MFLFLPRGDKDDWDVWLCGLSKPYFCPESEHCTLVSQGHF